MNNARFINFADQIVKHPEYSSAEPFLWDLTQASVGDLCDISSLSRQLEARFGNSSSGKTAFVVNSDLGYGLSRAASSWLSTDDGREYRVFRGPTINEAEAWLLQD